MRAIIVKKAKEKFKNRNKKIKPKIINSFLVSNFISSSFFKSQKIAYYYSNVTPATNFRQERDCFNLVYFYYHPRFKTKDKAKIDTNSSRSIQLASFTSPTKPLYIIKLDRLISYVLYFIKCKLV